MSSTAPTNKKRVSKPTTKKTEALKETAAKKKPALKKASPRKPSPKKTISPAKNEQKCTCKKCSPHRYQNDKHTDPTKPDAHYKKRFSGIKKFSRTDHIEINYGVHEYLKLALACASTFATDAKLTASQTDALDVWYTLKDTQRSKRNVSLLTMRQALTLFDELFFCGSLQGTIIVISNNIVDENNDQLHGITTYVPGQRWAPLAQIMIDPKFCNDKDETKHKSDNIFLSACGCLLHEMCHAFLDMYSCEGGDNECSNVCRGIDNAACNKNRNDSAGRTGHARAWHTLAKAIQDRSASLLGTEMHLFDVADAVAEIEAETQATENAESWVPSKCDLQKLFSSAEAKEIKKAITKKNNKDKRKKVKEAASIIAKKSSMHAIEHGRIARRSVKS